MDNTCYKDRSIVGFSLFIGFVNSIKYNMDYHQSYPLREVYSYSEQEVARDEGRRSSHDTSPLSFWFQGQSEHPPRSSVNHITLNHTRWAPGCRLQIHQRSETSVAGAVSVGQKREGFIGTARHLMPCLCYVTVVMSSVWSVLYCCRE